MAASRRTLVAGLIAAIPTCAIAQTPPVVSDAPPRERLKSWRKARGQKNNAAAPTEKGFAAAAAYSAARHGVSLVVMQNGKVLFEDYPAPDGGAEKGWELASGTKSFTGVMAAAAVADGFLSLDEPVADTIPEWKSDPRLAKVTVRLLLTLSSGVAIEGATARPRGYAETALAARSAFEPGEMFEYGPEPFQIFGEVLSRRLKSAGENPNPASWLQTRLFDRLGIRPVDWKTGPDGNPMLPQGAHFAALAWAKFGQWVFDGAAGVDPGVAKAWFEGTTPNPGYGLSWWLLRPGLKGPNPRAGVNEATIGQFAMAQDIVMAAGAGFQRLYLCRKHNLVVVRQANNILAQMRPGGIPFRDGEFLETLLG